MNTSESTISVDPGKITLGAKSISITNNLRADILHQPHHLDMTRALFASPNISIGKLNSFSIPLRTLFAAILIISGIYSISSGIAPLSLGIIEITIGGMLAIGFLSKIAMGVGTILFGALGILSLRAGMADIQSFTLCLGCVAFFLYGVGKYSCDNLIYMALRRYGKSRMAKKNVNEISYKSFANYKL